MQNYELEGVWAEKDLDVSGHKEIESDSKTARKKNNGSGESNWNVTGGIVLPTKKIHMLMP